ncbi:hypothetical protein ACFLU7_01390, partial [Chloroflexota bacterium]
MAIHDRPELEFHDIVAFSGWGSNAVYNPESVGRLRIIREEDIGIADAARNLDASFILGLPKGDYDFSGTISIFNNASKVIYFSNGDEAINYLKTAIASGHPVEVVLDQYYLYDDFIRVSDFWKSTREKRNQAGWMTVTG